MDVVNNTNKNMIYLSIFQAKVELFTPWADSKTFKLQSLSAFLSSILK